MSAEPVEFHRDLVHVQTVETRPFLLPVSGLGTRLEVTQQENVLDRDCASNV